MGEIIIRKVKGMNWKARISLMLVFAMLFSAFMYQGWYKPKPAQAAGPQVKKGTFVKNTATGAQAVTGIGFQPKAVIFWWTRQNTFATNAAGNSTGYGIAAGPTITQGSVAVADIDNVATSDDNFMQSTIYSIVILNPGAAGTPMVARASVTSLDADGFTLNWQTNEAQANQIHYMAIGGTDITNAKVGSFAGPAAAGSSAVTGVGFTPDALLFVSGSRTAVTWDAIIADGALNLGFATATSRAAIGRGARDAVTAATTGHAWSNTRAINGIRRNAIDQAATLTSMDADGFTLNFSLTAGACNYIYLALKGGLHKMGSFNKNTAAGAQSVAGLGLMPSGLMLLSPSDNVATDTIKIALPATNLSIGASDGTTSGSIWTHFQPLATTDTNMFTYNTNIMKMGVNANGTVTNYGEATLTSFDTDGFTLNWATSDATARTVIYWAIGGPPGDAVNVADGADPANYNAAQGNPNNVADSFTMVSTNVQNGLADVTGVTASFTNSANISGVRLYKDLGTVGTYDAGTDTLLSTGTPGASVSFTGFTENLTTTATNYLIVVDILGSATPTQTIDTSVTAVTVTAPDLQGTISDASNPTRLTIVSVPHEDLGTALNTAIATSPKEEGQTGVLMQRFQVTSATSGAGAQDNQLELNSLGIDDLGSATAGRTAKVYIDTTSSATLPGTAVLIGSVSSWTGGATTITLNQGTAADRTVANATPKYIYIVYDLPTGAGLTVQSSVTSVGVVSPDAGQTGLTLNSTAITLNLHYSSTITSCAGCHGYSAITDGTPRNTPEGTFVGSHNKHVVTLGKVCNVCHVTPATETSLDYGHRNSNIQIKAGATVIDGGYYDKSNNSAYDAGVDDTFAQTQSPVMQTCRTVYCHSQGTGATSNALDPRAWNAPLVNLNWGSSGTCSSCHGYPVSYGSGAPKANSHLKHQTQCSTCHNSTTNTSTTITDTTKHTNKLYDIVVANGTTIGSYTYAPAGGSCTTIRCHSVGGVSDTTRQWGTTLPSTFKCTTCHAVTQAITVGPAFGGTRDAVVGEFGLAWGHKASGKTPARGAVTDADCIVCHLEGNYTTQLRSTYHGDGYIDLRDPDVAGETRITNIAGTSYRFAKFSTSYAAGSRTSTGHQAENVDNILTQKFCLKCHDYNGAANTTARSGAGTWDMPFNNADLGASYTVTNGAVAAGGLIDVKTQTLTTNSSVHPVQGPNNRAYPYSTRLVVPYNGFGNGRDSNTIVSPAAATPRTKVNGVVIYCFDCHNTTPRLTSRTTAAHGNAVSLWGTYYPTATPTLCLGCHGGSTAVGLGADTYLDTTNGDHNPGSAFSVGDANPGPYIPTCQNCHFSNYNDPGRPVRASDIHGFNGLLATGGAWTYGASNGSRPIAFMRNVTQWTAAIATSPRPYQTPTLAAGTPSCSTASVAFGANASCTSNTHSPYAPGGSY